MIFGYKEGFEIVYDSAGNLKVEDDEVLLRSQGRIFPKIYKNWEHFGVNLVFQPLILGTVHITNKRLVFIGDTDPNVPANYRDFFTIPLDEVYGTELKKKTSVSGHDVNIYMGTMDGERYMVSMVIPDVGEEGIFPLIRDIMIDDLSHLKKNPKFYHSKTSYARRNLWTRYMMAIVEEGKMISDESGMESCIIEDIFVVTQSGILLCHDTWKSEKDMDDDIFSGMVHTLQNFIKDSFKEDSSVDLKEVDLGNFRIYIEKGQYTYLIVVYTGKINDKVRKKVQEALSEIESINRNQLEHWEGDVSKITGVKDILDQLF